MLYHGFGYIVTNQILISNIEKACKWTLEWKRPDMLYVLKFHQLCSKHTFILQG